MKKVRAITHQEVLRRLFKKPGFRQGYEEELDKLRLVDALVGLRQRQGLTQAALAKRLKVSQPFIAKLERAETHNFTLDTLLKVVEALNGELVLKIRSKRTRLAHNNKSQKQEGRDDAGDGVVKISGRHSKGRSTFRGFLKGMRVSEIREKKDRM